MDNTNITANDLETLCQIGALATATAADRTAANWARIARDAHRPALRSAALRRVAKHLGL